MRGGSGALRASCEHPGWARRRPRNKGKVIVPARSRECLSQTSCELVTISGLALPYDNDTPSRMLEVSDGLAISLDISEQFGAPESWIRLRECGLPTSRMLVPEAPVHEDGYVEARQDDVGRARKIRSV